MTQFDVKSVAPAGVGSSEGPIDSAPASEVPGGGYRTPRVFPIGRAKDLMRGNHGPVKDYSGWYAQP